MRQLLFIALLSLGLGIVGCGNPLAPAAPSPAIIVVTATPNAQPGTPAASPTGTPRPPSAGSVTPNATGDSTGNLKPTDVKYILAKQDINIRSGPGTDFDIVGGVYAGQTAEVTGYQSADGLWWRVVCPTDTSAHCWVSADPALTQASDAPAADATATATPASQAQLDTSARHLASSVNQE